MKAHMISAALLALASCSAPAVGQPTVREQEAAKAAQAAQAIDFSAGNAERDNILKRSQLVAKPDLLGYIVLLNFGRPVAYYTVKGKVTSSSKRLERPSEGYDVDCGEYCHQQLGPAPSYDGTFGDSDHYVYFWTISGQYVQWSSDYIYSDQPLQLSMKAADALAGDKHS